MALVSVICPHPLAGGAVLLAIEILRRLVRSAPPRPFPHAPTLAESLYISFAPVCARSSPHFHLLRFAVSGMEDCPDANRGAAATAAASLPDELILEILSRLPARSIHRFKCVSKRWRDLIADPLHQKRLPQTLEGFLCGDGARSHGRFISLPGRPAPLVDPSFSFLTKQPEMENIRLLGSCNGLVLLEHRSDPASTPSYAVCNPATEQWVAVPTSGITSHVGGEIYLIFYPAASPHFHLVRIWQKYCPGVRIEVRAYSSETRGWSDCVSDRLVNVGMGTARSGRIAFVNGMLYYIIRDMWKGVDQIVAMGREGKPRIVPLPDGNVPFTLFVAQSQGRFISLPGRPALLVDPSFSFLTKQPEMKSIKLLGSCNGLVLFEHRSDPASIPSYAVCNPATEQWVAVPSSGVTSHVHSAIGIIFNPAASPHFHLVRIWQKHCPGVGFEVRAYSSETRGWSDCVSDRLVNVGWGTARSGRIAFVNGMMYFIMWKCINQIVAMSREGKPSIIPLPDGNLPLTLFVPQSQGRLHCMSRHLGNSCPMTEGGLSIWVLEDYDAGHWVLKHSVSSSELFGKMCRFSFSVVSIHPDCGVFFIRYCDWNGDRQWKLLSYDMHSKELHAVHNFGHAICSLTPYVPYFSESSVLANKH